jgi:hypothetical protein
MRSVTATDESERRLAEALQARVTGAGQGATGPTGPPRRAAVRSATSTRTALLLALLGGAVLGTALALLSLLAPGVLPPLG